MTSSLPDQSNQLMMEPDPQAKTRRRRSEFWQICWLISLSSLLISIYSIFLVQRLAPAASQHDLDSAALVLADKIASLSIVHNRFGRVGILDRHDGQNSQMSFNRLQASLRLDAIAARQLGFDSMLALVEKDALEADKLAKEFAAMERAQLKSSAASTESFESLVRRELEKSGVAGRLKSLQISLGGLKSKSIDSGVPLPVIPEERRSFYASGDDYAVHVPVPISGELNYEFYESGQSGGFVSARDFVPVNEKSIASVLLVEAVFEMSQRGRKQGARKMQSCVLISSPPQKNPASVFMLAFPEGYLSRLSRINDLFAPDFYRQSNNECLQAQDGDIPGQGHLMPVSGKERKLSPAAAAMQSFYHFVFQLGPDFLPSNLQKLLNEPLAPLRKVSDGTDKADGAASFNCGLFKDTGAGRFALLKQSASGQSGQRALALAFSDKVLADTCPSYTFPLAVDEEGKLSLPQEDGFDLALLKDFLNELHQTNISGIESMEVAANIGKRMQHSIDNAEKKISTLQEELLSLKRSLKLLESEKDDSGKDKHTSVFKEQIEKLEQSIAAEETSKSNFLRIRRRATLVERNGRQSARSSYEIGSHMSSFALQGLKRITAPYKGFLLSRKIAFIPQTSPVDEACLYEPESMNEEKESPADFPTGKTSWISKHFKVTDIPDASIVVDKKPILEFWQSEGKTQGNKPFFVFLSSRELSKVNTKAKLFAGENTPFDNGSIPNLQLLYFAARVIESGTEPKCSWSFLIRDLVYSRLQGGGNPLPSINPHWCSEPGLREDGCPGLACEIQIRTPLPELGPSLESTYLQDPDGGPPIPLYPPLPAEML